MTKDNNKQEYDAPMVEILEARVEKGFTLSGQSEIENYTRSTGNTGDNHYVFS